MINKTLFLTLFLLAVTPAARAADISSDALIEQLLGDQKSAPDAAAKRAVLQKEIAVQDVLIKEAQKGGLTQTPGFAVRMELARRSVIIDTYWQAFLDKHPIEVASVRASYDQLKADNHGKQYRARQIYTEKEATAKQALDALARKESFESVAAKYSQDPGTNTQGGDLGWHLKADLILPVADAMMKMKPGEISPAPIVIDKGYVILKLEEVRDFPEFDSVKQQIANSMIQQARQEEVKRLQAAK